jgi:serine/threonine-protein kinase
LFERQSLRVPVETELDDATSMAATLIPLAARGPTPTPPGIDALPTTTDQPAVMRLPPPGASLDARPSGRRMMDLPPEPKSSPRSRPSTQDLPPEPKSSPRSRPPMQDLPPEPRSSGNKRLPPEAIVASKPVASAPVQPLPSAPSGQKNPWGEGEGSGTDPTSPRNGLVGLQLGEYKVLEHLGQGGMGVVYRGEHPVIGKRVAIKVLRPELASDPKQLQRLKDEAKAVNAIRHPGIVDIFGFNQAPDGSQYFVMELLEGQSLEEMLHQRGRLKAWEAVPILEQALAALDAAHGAGVIHRDLKPSNMFMVQLPDHTHLVKLLDFGLAKIGGAPRGSTPQTSNVVVGTPEYMAPEQARAQDVSPRTDLYAMGIVAYELLTGDVPFTSESAVETLMMQLDMPPTPPGEREPTIPPAIEKLILRMLAKRPEDRPGSAAEVKRELHRIKRAMNSAETIVADKVSLRAMEETLPSGLHNGPTPVNNPRPIEAVETKASVRAMPAVVNPTSRFETTEQLQPVQISETPPARPPLEPRPATEPNMMAAPAPRRWVVPLAALLALIVLAGVAFVVLGRPTDPPPLVAPPPPAASKDPPRAVTAEKPDPAEERAPVAPVKADPPQVGKSEGPKAVTRPPPVRRPQHTQEEALKRIQDLTAKAQSLETSQKKHLALVALEGFRSDLLSGVKSADQTWKDLDTSQLLMLK